MRISSEKVMPILSMAVFASLLYCIWTSQPPSDWVDSLEVHAKNAIQRRNDIWVADYKQALEKASQEKKIVVAYFYDNESPLSQRIAMEKKLTGPDVKGLTEKVIFLKIKDIRYRGWAWGVSSLPTVIFLNETGREITRFEGLRSGTEFAQILCRAAADRNAGLLKGENDPDPNGNLVLNGNFTNSYSGWIRSTGAVQEGVNLSEIIPGPPGKPGNILHLKHRGQGSIKFIQIVEVPNTDLIFSASYRVSEQKDKAFKGFGQVLIGITYVKQDDTLLGQEFEGFFSKDPFGDSTGNEHRAVNKIKPKQTRVSSEGFNNYQIDIRKKSSDLFLRFDPKSLKKLIIEFVCSGSHPQAEAELWITDISLAPPKKG